MIRIYTQFTVVLFTIVISLLFIQCSEKIPDTKEMKEYISLILKERAEKDSSFMYDPHSPFKRGKTVEFANLKYFDPNPDFLFKSKLYYDESPDTVFIMGTRGERRNVIVLGHVNLDYKGESHKVNVYRAFGRTGEEYHSIWFTDRTTGKETYGVGRYLDFELNSDSNFVYTIDFNKAYNPYCAYNSAYTCPIPREEDYIDISIEAGEKNFH